MYGEIFSLFKDFLAVFFIGLTIKITDDFIDAEVDELQGKTTWSNYLGRAALPYTLIFFTLAVLLNKSLSLPFFLSAYAVGMGKDLNRNYPLMVSGWWESILTIAVSIYFYGWVIALSSLALIMSIQFIDDLLDYSWDRKTGEKNFVCILGKGEVIVSLIILLLASFMLAAYKSFLVVTAYPLIVYLTESREEKEAA